MEALYATDSNIQPARRNPCCVKSNAPIILILIWNFCAAFGFEFFVFPLYPVQGAWTNEMRLCVYCALSILYLIYPLAGYFADTRWGRHRTIFSSLRMLVSSLAMILVLCIIGVCVSMTLAFILEDSWIKSVSMILLCLVLGLPILLGLVVIIFSLIMFNANVIQYGLDQLIYNNSGEDSTLYAYWYVWTCYLAEFVMKVFLTFYGVLFIFINTFIFLIVVPITVGITLRVRRKNAQWMFVETRTTSPAENPYKVFYHTIIFGVSNKNSLCHWSDNYCKEPFSLKTDLNTEINSRGHFTSAQIDDVKSFVRNFGILLTLGPVLMVDSAIFELLPNLVPHMNSYPLLVTVMHPYRDGEVHGLLKSLISSGALSPFVIVLALPLYIGHLRPCLHSHIPGVLDRIRLGMVFVLLSALCTLLMDVSGLLFQAQKKTVAPCFFSSEYYLRYEQDSPVLDFGACFLTVQIILKAVGYMLLYMSTYEFICTQSPQSTKGVLICSFFAIKGVFRLLGALLISVPLMHCHLPYISVSCGLGYYIINAMTILVGIVALTIAIVVRNDNVSSQA